MLPGKKGTKLKKVYHFKLSLILTVFQQKTEVNLRVSYLYK